MTDSTTQLSFRRDAHFTNLLYEIWREAIKHEGKTAGKQAAVWRQVCANTRRRRQEASAMQIRVPCGCGESSCPEWAVVELQGVVQPQPSFAGDIRGLHIGRLCSGPSPSSQIAYTFTVGYHELAGTKVTLKKPLLVLRKKKVNVGGGDQEPSTTPAPGVELEVIGIIRHKILFKDRPKALISKPPTKEKILQSAAA